MALVRFKGMPQLPSLENQCLDVALVNCYFKYLLIFNFFYYILHTSNRNDMAAGFRSLCSCACVIHTGLPAVCHNSLLC